jgi:microcystin-dependent protein
MVDKINFMATPVVELSLEDPVNDQNFFRNGNFYSSFWTTPAGISCPIGVWTTNASYWLCNPFGAPVNFLRSSTVPDLYSLFSAEIQGAPSVTDVEFGQQISGDLCATLRRNVTFSGYMYNATGLVVSPKLKFYTADVFNNFATVTLQTTINLQSGPDSSWTYMTATLDLTATPNVANGMLVSVLIPGALNAVAKDVLFSRLKIQIGEVATEFVDDTSLFVQAPSVDSTMLQDGCIARPGLFQPNVIPTGAYQAKSINNGDINDGAIDGRTMVPSVSTTLSTGFTQPAVSSTVPITVALTTGFLAGQPLTIVGGGAYTIFSVTDATHMVVTNTGATGNVAPLISVPSGGAVYQASAAVTNLGYTPINKAGDTAIGPNPLSFTNDTVASAAGIGNNALLFNSSTPNAGNDGYFPSICFNRPGTYARQLGLSIAGRFKTVDHIGNVGYLLDSQFKVATADVQDQAITLAKLAQEVINMIIPPGIMHFFAGPSPPGGWLVADGSAVSRITFAALFAAIGTYWGAGDNVNTFNLPDLRGRTPIGYVNIAAPGITPRAFAARGGEESHTLSIAEMANHGHPSNGAHQHTYVNPIGGLLGVQTGPTQVYSPSGTAFTSATDTGVQNSGGNAAHNIMQPFSVGYWIVKV